MKTPHCKKNGIDCPNRFLGCHDSCKEYQEYAAEREKIRNMHLEELREREYFKLASKRIKRSKK